MKLTIPQSILISALIIGLAIFFRLDEAQLMQTANAEIAGMHYYDLKHDIDFRKAVESIVEDCSVEASAFALPGMPDIDIEGNINC